MAGEVWPGCSPIRTEPHRWGINQFVMCRSVPYWAGLRDLSRFRWLFRADLSRFCANRVGLFVASCIAAY